MAVESGDLRLAVLIDADNIPYKSIKLILDEIALYGTPTLKRIYGDFSKQQLSGWKNVLLENAITPVQHFGYTTGKNSTDSAMVIDAMDILYEGKVDGFCIVSSDSDFTRLVMRLRESGLKVYGFGEKKTPGPFIAACDKFVYIEVLQEHVAFPEKTEETEPPKEETGTPPVQEPAEEQGLPNRIVELIVSSIRDISDEDGWAFLGTLGSLLIKKQPDFDPRNFGFRSLTPLVKTIPGLETDTRRNGNNGTRHIYVRVRRETPPPAAPKPRNNSKSKKKYRSK